MDAKSLRGLFLVSKNQKIVIIFYRKKNFTAKNNIFDKNLNITISYCVSFKYRIIWKKELWNRYDVQPKDSKRLDPTPFIIFGKNIIPILGTIK